VTALPPDAGEELDEVEEVLGLNHDGLVLALVSEGRLHERVA
jgi:hypothetical protein